MGRCRCGLIRRQHQERQCYVVVARHFFVGNAVRGVVNNNMSWHGAPPRAGTNGRCVESCWASSGCEAAALWECKSGVVVLLRSAVGCDWWRRDAGSRRRQQLPRDRKCSSRLLTAEWMLQRACPLRRVSRPHRASLVTSRSISVPYRRMAGVPSTYDGTRLPHTRATAHCLHDMQPPCTLP
jgi:hypothetical protein